MKFESSDTAQYRTNFVFDKNFYKKYLSKKFVSIDSAQYGIKSVTYKFFYKNVYLRNSS